MRGIIFTTLVVLVGALIGIGLEKVASFLPQQMDYALTRVYGLGVHPLSLHVSLCGIIGLVLGYVIISKFVKK